MDVEKMGPESGLSEPSSEAAAENAPVKKSGAARTLLLLLLLVAGLGAGLYLFGGGLFSPAPEVVRVESPAPSKIKVPARPEPVEKAEAVKEEVVAPDQIAALTPPAVPAPVLETKSEPPPVFVPSPAFALVSRSYLYQSALSRARSQIERMGYRVTSSHKPEAHEMTRLLVGRYAKPLARKRLAEVKKLSGEAFLAAEDGKFAVYAGSFLDLDKARRLADLLYQEGVRVEEVRVMIDLPRTTLRFGAFATRAEAKKVVDELGRVGVDKLQIVPFE